MQKFKLYVRTTYLLLILEASKIGAKTSCQEQCSNYVNLTLAEAKLDIERKEINIKIKEYPPFCIVTILERMRYRVVIKKDWGDKPVTRDLMHVIPEKDEALKWYNKDKCYIGTICPPNGDCWAQTADKCWEDKYEHETSGRSFQFEGAQWSTSFHYACTQDYSCSIEKKEVQINFNSNLEPYVIVGNMEIIIPSSKLNYTRTQSFGVIVDPLSKIFPSDHTANCIIQKDKFYCDTVYKGNELYFELDPGAKATTYNNLLIFAGKGQYKIINEQIKAKAASLIDLNVLVSSLMVVEANMNYNDYIINRNLGQIINLINKIIISLSASDPLLLSRILGEDIIAKPVYRNKFLEICRCEKRENYEFDCFNFNQAHDSKLMCSPPASVQLKNLDLLKFSESKTVFMDHIKFRGVDKTIYEDNNEKEFDLDHYFDETGESHNPNFGIPNFFSYFGGNILYVVIAVHSCLIFLLLIRR